MIFLVNLKIGKVLEKVYYCIVTENDRKKKYP